MAQFGPGLPDSSRGHRPLSAPGRPAQSKPAPTKPMQPAGDWCGGDSLPDSGWCRGGEPPEPWCDTVGSADTIVLGAVAGLVRALGRRLS